MRAIVIEDEKLALNHLLRKLDGIPRIQSAVGFSDPEKALDYLCENGSDVAFLDIDLGENNGLVMAKQIKEICPACAIIFTTAHSEYAVDAFRVRASGYLIKPFSISEIEEELEHISGTVPVPAGKRLSVRCFGNFEVFSDGAFVKFERSKTKELFAYLIDRRGAQVTIAELVAVLWEDKPDSPSQRSQLRKLISDLSRALKSLEAENVLMKGWGTLAVAADALDCDYYSYLKGEIWAVNSFTGEYMSSYSWAEMTLGLISKK